MPAKTTCQFCDNKFGHKQIILHYKDCIKENFKNESGTLLFMFGNGINGHVYYMYCLADESCKMSDVDKFLKNCWCECCGHLSDFHTFPYGKKIGKSKLICDFIEKECMIQYTYDYGSSTEIIIDPVDVLVNDTTGVKNTRKTKLHNPIKVILQNPKPLIKCTNKKCQKEATYYCYDNATCCAHIPAEDRDVRVPICNSPRSGVCCYGRSDDSDYLDSPNENVVVHPKKNAPKGRRQWVQIDEI